MAKYCSKCGIALKKEAKFCASCGTPVKQTAVQGAGTAGTVNPGAGIPAYGAPHTALPTKAQKGKPPVVLAAVCIAVAVIAVNLLGTRGYEKPVKYLEEGLNEMDADALKKAFLDEYADTITLIMDNAAYVKEYYDGDYKIKLTITDKEKLDKDGLEETLEEDYGVPENLAEEAKAGYILEVKAEMTIDDETETGYDEMVVAKIDGDWVIVSSLLF